MVVEEVEAALASIRASQEWNAPNLRQGSGGTKAEQHAYSMQLMAGHLKAVAEALEHVQGIVEWHSSFMDTIANRRRLTNIALKHGNMVLTFGYGEEAFDVMWQTDRRRWEIGESSHSIIRRTGVSADYLEGVLTAANLSEGIQKVAEKAWAVLNEESTDRLRYAAICDQRLRDLLFKHMPILPDVLRLHDAGKLQSVCSEYERRRELMAARRLTREAAWKRNMPEVPAPQITAKSVKDIGEVSGVYFLWDGTSCVYVGKSKNIGQRLSSHTKLQLRHDVSWLRCSEKQMHTWELFYIWLLQPELNGEVIKAMEEVT